MEHERRGTATVLLVEDEPSVLNLTGRMLEHLGYAVIPANTPSEAIRLAEAFTGEIHLLLSDVVMPEMSGFDLSQRLRSVRPKIRRLFMSGYAADIVAAHGVLDVHFLQKPFSSEALGSKVRQVMEE